MRRYGTSSAGTASKQEQRQAMINIDTADYMSARLAVKTRREQQSKEKRNKVLDTFLKEVRPRMEAGNAYSQNEMEAFYHEAYGAYPGMFTYLLLHEADFLNVKHVCQTPTFLQITKVPTGAAKRYFDYMDALDEKAKAFTIETGLSVRRPKRLSAERIESLVVAVIGLCTDEEIVQISQYRFSAYLGINYKEKLTADDFRALDYMGVKYKKIKAVSAFWIERQF